MSDAAQPRSVQLVSLAAAAYELGVDAAEFERVLLAVRPSRRHQWSLGRLHTFEGERYLGLPAMRLLQACGGRLDVFERWTAATYPGDLAS